MRELLLRWLLTLALCLVMRASIALAQDGWGDIKGRVVWTDPVIPAAREIDLSKSADRKHCETQDKLRSNELLIDAKSKGVANVMVWLAAIPKDPTEKPTTPLPIRTHPSLKNPPAQKVVIDQPCCNFEPRVVMFREGQVLEIKNSASISHAAMLVGARNNKTPNSTIQPGQSMVLNLKAETRPLGLSCSIHFWMGGQVFVLNHPYFALTKEDGSFEIKNAPDGKFLLFIKHEKAGWLQQGAAPDGQMIHIAAGKTLDLGKIELKADRIKGP